LLLLRLLRLVREDGQIVADARLASPFGGLLSDPPYRLRALNSTFVLERHSAAVAPFGRRCVLLHVVLIRLDSVSIGSTEIVTGSSGWHRLATTCDFCHQPLSRK
jgi:hypothetical protein